MGLLSSRRSSTTVNETDVTNLSQGFENIDGTVLAGSGSLTITNTATDGGALDAAASIADRALSVGLDVSREALDVGRSALDTALLTNQRGLDNALAFGSRSLSSVDAARADALNLADRSVSSIADLSDRGFSFAESTLGAALRAVGDATDAAIGGVQSLARQTTASEGDRVSKVAIYAVLAVAAALALPAIFRGKA